MTDPAEALRRTLRPAELTTLGVDAMTPEQQQTLHNALLRAFALGQHRTGGIVEIHEFQELHTDDDDDGRKAFGVKRSEECSVIELNDGTSWRVESHETYALTSWFRDDVVIIDDRMYRLDELESVPVERLR